MATLVYRSHAVRRMFERQISAADVEHVVANGRTIESYPTDQPYPSRLMLGLCGRRPLHVVVADNREADEVVIVTVYEPAPERWYDDYVRRKP
jgi:hypothetical protein